MNNLNEDNSDWSSKTFALFNIVGDLEHQV